MTYTRQDIWLAEEEHGVWNELVLAYAIAFGHLQNESFHGKRPESWTLTYQAEVHDMDPTPPLNDLRATCQHATWFFLPWHRMYLYYFEAVIRAVLETIEDARISDEIRQTWALPYWNYQQPHHRVLPTAFRESNLPDGEINPLAQADRFPYVQDGSRPLSSDQVEYMGWWNEGAFTLPRTPSFGGADSKGPRHSPMGSFPDMGALENTPHGSVHMYVGRDMGRFDRAGLDPIFWLHHCNLDRLWEVWRTAGTEERHNPDSEHWKGQKFKFLDATGQVRDDTPRTFASTLDLKYRYQDLSAPQAPASPTRSRAMAVPEPEEWQKELAPRALGSTSQPIVMRSTANAVDIGLVHDSEVTTRAQRPGPARLILQVANIKVAHTDVERLDRGEAVIGSYAIYLEGTREGVEAYAGNLPLFGLRESQADDGHELTYSFDVTAAVNLLREEAAWSWDAFRVRIVPDNHEVYEGAGDVVPVEVGNVTLSYQ